MGDYYDFEDSIFFYDFLIELIFAVLFLNFGIYVIVRMVRNFNQQYIDALKIIQLLLLLGICLRLIISFLIQLLTYRDQTQIFFLIFVYLDIFLILS